MISVLNILKIDSDSLNHNPTLTVNAKIEEADVPGAQSAHRAVFNVENGTNVSYIIKTPDNNIVRIFSLVKSSEGVTSDSFLTPLLNTSRFPSFYYFLL